MGWACATLHTQPCVYASLEITAVAGGDPGGGFLPLWRADGRELFYLAPEGKVMSVEVKTDGTFENAAPKQLFQTNILRGEGVPYSVSPDGSRFLIEITAEDSSTPLAVVLNWTARLKHPS